MFIFPRARKVIVDVRIRGSNIHIDRFYLKVRGLESNSPDNSTEGLEDGDSDEAGEEDEVEKERMHMEAVKASMTCRS